MAPDAPDFSSMRRALVVKLRHHGDVLLSSPVFTALKAHAPHLALDALVYDDTREMISLHPAIDQIHCVDRQWRTLPALTHGRAEWALWQRLRDARYDLLIHLTDHPRGAWLARTLGTRVSVAPRRQGRAARGVGGRWWRSSFTHHYPVIGSGRRHTVETHLDALRRIGIYPQPDQRRLHMEPGAAAWASVDDRLAQAGLQEGSFIHFHPASRWLFKCWPTAQAARLIDALHAQGEQIVLTGAPTGAERDMIDQIIAHCARPPLDWSGRLSLKEMAALSARARLFIGVDSAPMHIAAAMGTPSVAVFGPSGEQEWGPWQVPHRVVSSAEHPCRPCGLDGCGGGKRSDCIERLTVAQVLGAARELLAYPAGR